ncbi:MAG: TonB-dependent receptor [Muribaculaceae bacterium]|nr:TonB-dependent receptor [Muribaculaceae bacterium]
MNTKKFILILALSCGQMYAQEASDSLSHQLHEIVVTANQPATKLVGSTLVSTISGSNLAHLGNALDVLAQLPMVKVENNNVSVIGKSNVEVYIDGRPMRDNLELVHLLSTNLQTIELLMAPGAAYDSTTDAVIRIITKPNHIQGISITDQFNLQCRRKWSIMDYLSLNYRFKRWEMFVSGTFNYNNSVSKGITTNTFIYRDKPIIIGSSQYNSIPTTVGSFKAGFNYSDDGQSFGAYYRYNPEQGDFKNSGSEWIDNEAPVGREINKRINADSHLVSAYYEDTFADKYRLHFDGDFRQASEKNNVTTSYPESVLSDVNSADKRTSMLLAGKLTFDLPLWNGNLSFGTQDSYTHSSLDFQMLNDQVSEYIPSSKTDAKQTSANIFASWSRNINRFSLSVGARYEYVNYNFTVNGTRDKELSRSDHLLTPDLSFGYSFNDFTQISLAYKMSTVKPPYSQLTGSLNYVGRYEIEGGNSALRDERMHNVQFFGMWKGLMMQADFSRCVDTYAFIKELYPAKDLQLLMHPVNINLSALNLFLIWIQPVGCWNPNFTLGMYRQWLKLSGKEHNKPIFSYYFDNTFVLPRGWTITANFCGRTRGDMHTNCFGATWFTMDASIGKTLFNEALTLKLNATDIFNTVNNDWKMNTYGVTVNKRQSYDYRGVSLSVIYNLNPRKSGYKGSSAAQSELDRL